MLLRLLLALGVGALLAAITHQVLCGDAPNPTLANPAWCGPNTGWMTSLTAFLFGAGLVWVLMLWRARARPAAPPRDTPPAGPPA